MVVPKNNFLEKYFKKNSLRPYKLFECISFCENTNVLNHDIISFIFSPSAASSMTKFQAHNLLYPLILTKKLLNVRTT